MFSNMLEGLLRRIPHSRHFAWQNFLNSPFFNEDKKLSDLFAALKPELNGQPELSKEEVWFKIYNGEKKYNDGMMRQHASALGQLVQQFIAYETWQSNGIQPLLDTLSAVATPETLKQKDAVVRKIEEAFKKHQMNAADLALQHYLFHDTMHRLEEQTAREKITFAHFEKAELQLDVAYYTLRLRQYCELPSYALFKPIENLKGPNEQWLYALKASDAFLTPNVQAWWNTYRLLALNEETAFYEQRLYLREHFEHLDRADLYQLYTHLKNYCIYQKINRGQTEWNQTLFDLYTELLDLGVLEINNKIDPQHFKNIVTLGIHVNQSAWTKDFIQQYKDKLPEGNKDNIIDYNMAKVFFNEEVYSEVIAYLAKVEFQDQTIALGSKVILMKTYYELKEWRLLDSHLDSFNIYIRRHKNLSRELQSQYLNLIRFSRKLYKLPPRDKAAKSKLHTEISNCQSLASKDWFLEKTKA